MEQAILAELWQVLDTSDLESVTSKEVGSVAGPATHLSLGTFSPCPEAFPSPSLQLCEGTGYHPQRPHRCTTP